MRAMKRAHEIRKEAAAKWNCKTSEIVFSICLEMAWAEIKRGNEMDTVTKISYKTVCGKKVQVLTINGDAVITAKIGDSFEVGESVEIKKVTGGFLKNNVATVVNKIK